VSQALCHAMDGRIRVESEYGKGSCFTIEIAAHLERQAPPEAAEPETLAA
jgi:signal transduction histidine kinase